MSELLTLGRMAARLGVTQQWLRDQAESGKVPCLRAGKRVLFSPAAVQEELAAQAGRKRRAPSEPQQQHENGSDTVSPSM